MTKTITTTKSSMTGLWYITDVNGEALCSSCHTFHQFACGYKTRRLARQAIRKYTGTYTLIGGLH